MSAATPALKIVDVSQISVPVLRASGARKRRRSGTSPVAAFAIAAAVVIGTAAAASLAGGSQSRDTALAPVAGDFRLGPGNLAPLGIVHAKAPSADGYGPVPGEFRLGPGNLPPVGVAGS